MRQVLFYIRLVNYQYHQQIANYATEGNKNVENHSDKVHPPAMIPHIWTFMILVEFIMVPIVDKMTSPDILSIGPTVVILELISFITSMIFYGLIV